MTVQARVGERSLRILTYNILLGGARRHDLIASLVERTGADVVALQEASDVAFVRQLAGHLGMEAVIGEPSDGSQLNLAVLSRLPVARSLNRRHPGRMLRSHLECDVGVGGLGGRGRVRIHCLHLAARFGERANGETRRMRELTAVLEGIGEGEPLPHVVAGDFNAVAPGEPMRTTLFFARMAELRRAGLLAVLPGGRVGPRQRDAAGDGLDEAWLAAGIDPRLDVGVPDLPRAVGLLTGSLPCHPYLDRMVNQLVDRRTVRRLLGLGYVDCFRTRHPRAMRTPGYTCATWVPAARIDYIFASPDLAPALTGCEVVGSDANAAPEAAIASDHFPVLAELRV